MVREQADELQNRRGTVSAFSGPAPDVWVLDSEDAECDAVAVLACDDDVIPDAERVGTAASTAETEAVYGTERHLLYVACTRARDRLLVTGVGPGRSFWKIWKRGRRSGVNA